MRRIWVEMIMLRNYFSTVIIRLFLNYTFCLFYKVNHKLHIGFPMIYMISFVDSHKVMKRWYIWCKINYWYLWKYFMPWILEDSNLISLPINIGLQLLSKSNTNSTVMVYFFLNPEKATQYLNAFLLLGIERKGN